MAAQTTEQPVEGLFVFDTTSSIPDDKAIPAKLIKPLLHNVATIGAGIETVLDILQDHDATLASDASTFFNDNQIGRLQALATTCIRLMTDQAHELIGRLEGEVH